MGRVSYQSVHLIYTMDNGSDPLKNGLGKHKSKTNMINFLIVPSNRLGQGASFFLLTFGLNSGSIRRYWQNQKKHPISEITWWTPPALLASTHPQQDVKQSASQPRRKLCLPVRKPFKEPIKKK